MTKTLHAQIAVRGNVCLRDQWGREQRTQNVLVSGGLTLIRDFLASVAPEFAPTPPSWIVLGSGTAPVGRFAMQVPGETFRAPIIARDTVGGNGVVYHAWISDADNANQTLGTVGLVGGSTASQSPGTGTLVAIANIGPLNKDAVTTLAIDWALTCSGIVS